MTCNPIYICVRPIKTFISVTWCKRYTHNAGCLAYSPLRETFCAVWILVFYSLKQEMILRWVGVAVLCVSLQSVPREALVALNLPQVSLLRNCFFSQKFSLRFTKGLLSTILLHGTDSVLFLFVQWQAISIQFNDANYFFKKQLSIKKIVTADIFKAGFQ